jgi:hypothetical protein
MSYPVVAVAHAPCMYVCYYTVLSEVVRAARAARSTQRPKRPEMPATYIVVVATVPYYTIRIPYIDTVYRYRMSPHSHLYLHVSIPVCMYIIDVRALRRAHLTCLPHSALPAYTLFGHIFNGTWI